MKMSGRMQRLYERLEAFGIPRSYTRAVALPAGWHDPETENPAVYSQALGLLARNLNISLRSLQNESSPLEWQDCGSTRFKRNQSLSDDELTTAKCLAVRAAQIACEAMQTPAAPIPTSGAAIREAIRNKGHRFVSFETLLDYCWDCGIPVLHVSRFPTGAHKPDALAGIFNGRLAIVITKQHKYAAWLLFILAHELGHIAKQHVQANGVLVDENIDQTDGEQTEAKANAFAVELLTGQSEHRYSDRKNLATTALIHMARTASERDGVDPGYVALNYAHSKLLDTGNGHFALANRALSVMEPNTDPVAAIHARMCDRLDWEEIGRDSRHFLRSIAKMTVS
jgi:hypothetical protein